jgi:hypothetical protein
MGQIIWYARIRPFMLRIGAFLGMRFNLRSLVRVTAAFFQNMPHL